MSISELLVIFPEAADPKRNTSIDSKTPKSSIKELYRIGYSNEETYRSLINMINDRNMLSHIYNEEEFNKIYNKLPEYLKAMKTVQNYIEQEALENL